MLVFTPSNVEGKKNTSAAGFWRWKKEGGFGMAVGVHLERVESMEAEKRKLSRTLV